MYPIVHSQVDATRKKKLDEIGLGRIELMSPSGKILLLHERMMKWGWRDLKRWREDYNQSRMS